MECSNDTNLGIAYTANCDEKGETLAGDLYIEDIVTASLEICGGQKVYARQLNTENSDLDIKIWNDGLL